MRYCDLSPINKINSAWIILVCCLLVPVATQAAGRSDGRYYDPQGFLLADDYVSFPRGCQPAPMTKDADYYYRDEDLAELINGKEISSALLEKLKADFAQGWSGLGQPAGFSAPPQRVLLQ